MNFDIAAVRARIKSLLETVSELGYVYDYNNPNVEGYPCAIFDATQEQAIMFDEVSNLRTIEFTIQILQEIPVSGEQAAKDLLDATAKAVINILENKSNDTLGDTVDWVMPVTGRRTHMATPQGAVYAQEILLKVNVAASIL